MKKINRSRVFKIAWALKRTNADNDFGACLKMAYEVEKNSEFADKLEALGFSYWSNYGYERYYINADKLGLYVEHYKTGNISYAEFDGEKISNGYARESQCKIWWDVKEGRIVSKGSKNDIVDEMVRRAEALVVAEAAA